MLILDEPTAALDPIAENKLYENYHNITSGKTSVFISHRLASTRFCSRIILINSGKIEEEGTHAELLQNKAFYYKLFGTQAEYLSHRLSSCRFCDDIAVFHEGELIQRGSHDMLIADKDGRYYELWSAQAQYYTE